MRSQPTCFEAALFTLVDLNVVWTFMIYVVLYVVLLVEPDVDLYVEIFFEIEVDLDVDLDIDLDVNLVLSMMLFYFDLHEKFVSPGHIN